MSLNLLLLSEAFLFCYLFFWEDIITCSLQLIVYIITGLPHSLGNSLKQLLCLEITASNLFSALVKWYEIKFQEFILKGETKYSFIMAKNEK